MFCRYCGNNINGDSIFCEVCGKRLRDEQVNQAPVYSAPTNQQTVYQQTNNMEPGYYSNPTPAYTAPQASEAPAAQPTKNNYSAKYERITGYSGSLANEKSAPAQSTAQYNPEPVQQVAYNPTPVQQVAYNPQPAPKIEYKPDPKAVAKPKKKKRKGILPYIMLPVSQISGIICLIIGVVVAAVIANVIYRYEGYNDVTFGIFVAIDNLFMNLGLLIGIVPFIFSCRAKGQKASFLMSCYAGQMGSLIGTILIVIIGYVILYTKGFYSIESSTDISAWLGLCIFIGYFCFIPVSIPWFISASKYTVIKEKKTKPAQLIVGAVLLCVYGLFALAVEVLASNAISDALVPLFGEYSTTFASYVAKLIADSISFVAMFIFALGSKGGYRKVTFVGSAFLAKNLLVFLCGLSAAIFSGSIGYTEGFRVGQIAQYLLAIPVAVTIYLLLNRYQVEKVKKIKTEE